MAQLSIVSSPRETRSTVTARMALRTNVCAGGISCLPPPSIIVMAQPRRTASVISNSASRQVRQPYVRFGRRGSVVICGCAKDSLAGVLRCGPHAVAPCLVRPALASPTCHFNVSFRPTGGIPYTDCAAHTFALNVAGVRLGATVRLDRPPVSLDVDE